MLFSETWSKTKTKTKTILSYVKPLAAVAFDKNHLGRFPVKGGPGSKRLTGQLGSEGGGAWHSPADPRHGRRKAGRDTPDGPRGLQASRTHAPGCLPFLPRRPGAQVSAPSLKARAPRGFAALEILGVSFEVWKPFHSGALA